MEGKEIPKGSDSLIKRVIRGPSEPHMVVHRVLEKFKIFIQIGINQWAYALMKQNLEGDVTVKKYTNVSAKELFVGLNVAAAVTVAIALAVFLTLSVPLLDVVALVLSLVMVVGNYISVLAKSRAKKNDAETRVLLGASEFFSIAVAAMILVVFQSPFWAGVVSVGLFAVSGVVYWKTGSRWAFTSELVFLEVLLVATGVMAYFGMSSVVVPFAIAGSLFALAIVGLLRFSARREFFAVVSEVLAIHIVVAAGFLLPTIAFVAVLGTWIILHFVILMAFAFMQLDLSKEEDPNE